MRLDDARIRRLSQNLEQVLVADEVEPRKDAAFVLQVVVERLLTSVELVEHGRQIVLYARHAAQRDHSCVALHVSHRVTEVVVHSLEALHLLTRQRSTLAEYRLQIDPLALHFVQIPAYKGRKKLLCGSG